MLPKKEKKTTTRLTIIEPEAPMMNTSALWGNKACSCYSAVPYVQRDSFKTHWDEISSTDNYFFVQIKSDPRNLSGKWWTVSYLHRLFPVHEESKKKLETVVYCKPNCRYPPWCHNMSLPFQREENCLRKLFQWKWKVICPLIH